MQNLKKWIEEAKKRMTPAQMTNGVREYLQILILKVIYQSRYRTSLSFMGGTCLRICYDLKRYSEDLDFALDPEGQKGQKIPDYSFQELNDLVVRFLKQNGFEADLHIRDDKIVHKSFIRIREVLPQLGNPFRKNQKLHIKLEVDTNPIPVTAKQQEIRFVTGFGENFPVLKHVNETLFAGKVLAILQRVYTKGRDYYDLIWYLKNRIGIDLEYLNQGLRQAGNSLRLEHLPAVLEVVREKVKGVRAGDILADVEPFLADPSERNWMEQYQAAFDQMAASYLEGGGK